MHNFKQLAQKNLRQGTYMRSSLFESTDLYVKFIEK